MINSYWIFIVYARYPVFISNAPLVASEILLVNIHATTLYINVSSFISSKCSCKGRCQTSAAVNLKYGSGNTFRNLTSFLEAKLCERSVDAK